MELDLQHLIPTDPRTFWKLLSNPDFVAETDRAADITREILEQKELPDGRRMERARWTSNTRLPGFIARVIGSEQLTYELIQHIDDARMRLEWEIVPPIARDRFQGRGTYVVEEAPGGCIRRVTGLVKVSVPLVGRKIEERVTDETRRGYDRAAELARKWLSRDN